MKRIARKVLGYVMAPRGDRTLNIGGIALTVDYGDVGGRQYAERTSYEEINSQFYPFLKEALDPTLIVDVGANYGFTSLVYARHFPGVELVMIEPSPKLTKYIRKNLLQNQVSNVSIIESVCSSRDSDVARFSLNPSSSQDNRVKGLAGWSTISVPSVSLSTLLQKRLDERVFIKVDTQGFETEVFAGARPALKQMRQWLVKTEFAPNWIDSQGGDPNLLLRSLIENFDVIEAPARTRFRRDSLSRLFAQPLCTEEVNGFIAHVRALNAGGFGWVDLYVGPKRH